MLAHWLTNHGDEKYAYDIKLALSNDGGKSWGAPILPHRDNTPTEHGFVSLLPWDDDEFLIAWLDGRKFSPSSKGYAGHGEPTHEMALMAALIDSTGDLSEEILLDPRVCECCQTSAALINGGAVIVYRDRSAEEIRDIGIVRYRNGRWLEPQTVHSDGWKIEGCPVNGPAVDAIDDHVAVAWYTGADEASRVKIVFSENGGAHFGQPIQVDDGNPIGRVDLVMLPGGAALVSWLEQDGGSAKICVRAVAPDGVRGPARTIAQVSSQRASGFPRLARNDSESVIVWTDADEPSHVRTAVARFLSTN